MKLHVLHITAALLAVFMLVSLPLTGCDGGRDGEDGEYTDSNNKNREDGTTSRRESETVGDEPNGTGTVTDRETDETTRDEPVETVPEEELENGMYRMYPKVDEADVLSIEVHNENSAYKFTYDKGTGEFVLEGHKGLPYDKQKLTELIVGAGQALAISKITDSPTEKQLAEYGFKGEDAVGSYYILTTVNGAEHRVDLGEKTSGGAYCAMYGGRNTVYTLTPEVGNALLAPVEDMITPLLTGGDPASSMYIDNFTIRHCGEDFLVCRNRTKDELALLNSSAVAETVTVFPMEGGVMSMDYSTALMTLSGLTGDSVVSIDITDENLGKFGLGDKPYEILYECEGVKTNLTVSEPVDGFYYVASSVFKTIVKVKENSLGFLKWDYMKWIDPHLFYMPITAVDRIGAVFGGGDEVFDLTHNPNDANSLAVVGKNCGEITDIASFRNLYMTLLMPTIEGYITEDVAPSDFECILKLTVTSIPTSKDTVIENEYAFYRYTGGSCLLTVNGKGLLCVNEDAVNNIIDSAERIINKKPVSSQL